MSDVETAAPSAEVEHGAPEAPESFSSASEAAAFLARHAAEKRRQTAPQAAVEPDEPVSGEQPSEEPAQADLANEETQVEEAAEPPIPAPASWPKEEKDAFEK